MSKCLYGPCPRPLYIRGLCGPHHTAAAKLVRNGETTWDRLLELGKISTDKDPTQASARWRVPTKRAKCLDDHCKKPYRARGLCYPHYANLQHFVYAGVTTWEKLEKEGKVKPALSAPPPPSPFQEWCLNDSS